jgi:hypothetical protein
LIHFPQKVIAPRSLLPLRSRSISLIQFNAAEPTPPSPVERPFSHSRRALG